MIHVFYERAGDGKVRKIRLELDDGLRPRVLAVLDAFTEMCETATDTLKTVAKNSE